MKQKIFTLIMMLALVIVAGSAFAQGTYLAPYPNSSYTYTIDVAVTHNSTATVTVTNVTGAGATKATVTPGEGADAVTVGTTAITVVVNYAEGATGNKRIALSLRDNTSGCSNNIFLDVTVATPPTWNLAITSDQTDDDYGCQLLNTTTQASGNDATVGAPTNTIVFSVAPVGSAPAGATGDFSYDISVSGATCSTCGTGNTAADSYSSTFTTTEGAGFNVTGTISGTFTMDEDHGGGTYPMTPNGPLNVSVGALPTIGGFN